MSSYLSRRIVRGDNKVMFVIKYIISTVVGQKQYPAPIIYTCDRPFSRLKVSVGIVKFVVVFDSACDIELFFNMKISSLSGVVYR